MPEKCERGMAEKLDVPMNTFPEVTDAAYIYAEGANLNQVKIKKSDLANIIGELLNIDGMSLGFDGNFSNFKQWKKGGVYRYLLNTSDSGTIDGPYENDAVYGILEVIVRDRTEYTGLNVVVQKVYDRYNKLLVRICTRSSNSPIDSWVKGEWKQIY